MVAHTPDNDPIDDMPHIGWDHPHECWHTSIVSISETECQCMDCLSIWPKEPDFKSDWPQFDRG